MKFADFQFSLTRHYIHYEDSENREVSPPERDKGSSTSDDNDSAQDAGETEKTPRLVTESKTTDSKEEEEGTLHIFPVSVNSKADILWSIYSNSLSHLECSHRVLQVSSRAMLVKVS